MRITVTPYDDMREMDIAIPGGEEISTGPLDQAESIDAVRAMLQACTELLPEGCECIERQLDEVLEEMECAA